MNKNLQEKYIEQLTEIKQRSAVFQEFSKRKRDAIYMESTVEVEVLQLRRILEILAFSFVLIIGEPAVSAYIRFTKYKNAENFINELTALKNDFYPQPIIEKKGEDGRMLWLDPEDGTYLNADDYVTLFEYCNHVIEPQQVGVTSITFEECTAANIGWFKKIVRLLNAHLITIGEFAYLYQMEVDGKLPTCTFFEAVEGDAPRPAAVPIAVVDLNMSLAGHMRRQLNYIRRSCALYDLGEFDDAIRLAVCIRVLLHDTGSSNSLLKLMNVKSSVKLATSFDLARSMPPGMTPTAIFPLFASSAKGGVAVPFTLPSPLPLLSTDAWWSEIVWMQGTTLTRKDIVLACANKDGGAHIEPSPPKSIMDLRKGISDVSSLKIGGVEVGTPLNYHFILLRQFAHELLNSTDLTSLEG